MIILDFYTKNHEQSNIPVATIANELLWWDKLRWDELLIKPSRYGTIDNMQDNITFLHLHCNFPDISYIHHLCHWFQPIGFVLIPQHVKRIFFGNFEKNDVSIAILTTFFPAYVFWTFDHPSRQLHVQS